MKYYLVGHGKQVC